MGTHLPFDLPDGLGPVLDVVALERGRAPHDEDLGVDRHGRGPELERPAQGEGQEEEEECLGAAHVG